MKRRIAILTDAQWRLVEFGARYAVESCVDDHGDIAPDHAARIDRAREKLARAPERDVKRDADAIRKAIEVMLEECSCSNRVNREPTDHDAGCWVVIWRHDLERLRNLYKIFNEAP